MLWVYGVISNHIPPGHTHCPTQSHAHTFLIRSYPQSVLTELLICKSNFSSWIQVSIIALNKILGRRMIVCARVFQKRRKSSPKIHTCAKDFCFSTPYYCTANPPTDHSQQHLLQFVRQYSAYMSALSANRQHPRKIYIGIHGSDKQKYMWAWLWVGQWVWPVEKLSDITSKTHIIFLSRNII